MYIDPGSGSILFQLIGAALLGGVVACRKWVVDGFRRLFAGRKAQ